MPAASPWRTDPSVEVWHDTTEAWRSDPDRSTRGLAWLTASERVRYARFVHDEDRWMFLVGRVMARALVGRALGCAPTGWRWREGPHGRPEIDEPDVTWRFNVAHSAGLVVCALAEGHDVGVDVEDLQRRDMSPGFARRYLSPREVEDVHAQPAGDRQERLLTYWTLKEAYLKARGLGVSVPLSDIEFTLATPGPGINFLGTLAGTATNWHFHLTRPTARHLMAVASQGTSRVSAGHVFSAEGAQRSGIVFP